MKRTDARSPNELKWLDFKIGHQDSSPSKHHQGDIPTDQDYAVGMRKIDITPHMSKVMSFLSVMPLVSAA